MKHVETGAGTTPVVFIVDDDEMVRRGIARLVRSAGLAAETYASPRVLLAQGRREASGCIVLDLNMPDLDGLQAQEALSQAGYTMPVLFLTGHGDVSSSVTAMKAGAIDFLVKPVNHGELLDAIQRAVNRDLAARSEREQACALRERFALLTPREREVCDLVVAGLRNKQIAERLGTAEKTVKTHRGQVMHKLGVRSVVELVRLVDRVGDRTAVAHANRPLHSVSALRSAP
jgi:FixJ family two-component response regulator